ncbi:MAG: heat-inducible transcriptional repressor HrcA [Candidatus Marinimicrobia bacterium]|nr:heat-inducible transcriptional repressor HrcA [Candidatus Neomarinimicrobiota bacterium]MCF7851010.1 heat-inducible transcriptional repressor HrcA [Candidatus Neomarinimicrobiota bacterium]MCF7904936.1 heat-inducible transcriptional repressor HrcA [Candidatus Neomarinimicrobiota bacterium]
MGYELKTRDERVLKWLIRDHALSGQPVGSPQLVAKGTFGVSAATIRNVLHNLELSGYLTQPHTSAGRIPTEKGYRYFVDRLMEPEEPSQRIIREYESEISQMSVDLDMLVKNTAHFLGDVSHALVLMSRPHKKVSRIRSLALHEFDKDKILLIVNTNLDQVRTVAFEFESGLSRLVLKEAELILNDLFAGMDMLDIQKLVNKDGMGKARKNPLIDKILNQIDHILGQISTDYQIYGAHQLLHYPEMADPRIMELLLEALDTDHLQQHLPVPQQGSIPSVLIGGELGLKRLNNLSLVSIGYEGQDFRGDIHFVGPTRMAYEKVVSLATYSAHKMKSIIHTEFVK